MNASRPEPDGDCIFDLQHKSKIFSDHAGASLIEFFIAAKFADHSGDERL
jgi:hypothetical protein